MSTSAAGFVADDDDRTIGQLYSRRTAMSLLIGAGSALVVGACGGSGVDVAALADLNATLPAGCVVRPAIQEGPIFVDDQANRSDIRTDPTNGARSEGTNLALAFRVSTLEGTGCAALEGAQVDVWQCDAFGIYSDTNFENMGTVGQKFLRGHQFTDINGDCAFTTIYPGWYEGRAVHLHFKVRTAGQEFSSQLFFDPAMTDNVFTAAPYNTRGERPIRNDDDGIFAEGGDQMILDVQPAANGDGFSASFDITLDLT